MKYLFVRLTSVVVVSGALNAQQAVPSQQPPVGGGGTAVNGSVATSVVLPTGFVLGPEDLLAIVFWKDKDLSVEVVVRPDGKISLPLLNDVQAAGRTPEELRAALVQAASKYVEDPSATVVVKEIHSRKVFITGNIQKAGAYPLISDKTIAQLIAEAGGLAEYADAKNIVINRQDAGGTHRFVFNYKDFTKGKNLQQNIQLKPGDTIVVP